MTLEHLRRIDAINTFSVLCPIVKPINYARFAILSELERESCLKEAESLMFKIQAEKEKISLN